MSPKLVNKEEKKREIAFAAMQVFSEKGVVNTKISDIAVCAKIGKGTIYEYFKSKEDIFIFVFEILFSQIFTEISTVVNKSNSPSEKLKQIISLSVSSFMDNPYNMAEIMLDIWAEGIREHNEKLKKVFNLEKMYGEFRIIVEDVLQEGINMGKFREMDTTVSAAIIIGALDGILLQWLMQKDLFKADSVTDSFIRLFLNGIIK